MDLMKKIEKDLINAMREKDKFRLTVLRSVKSAIKYEVIESGSQLSDDKVMAILEKQVKSRQQAVELYVQGGRQELADKEIAEIKLISEYLPEALSKAEIITLVIATINKLQASSMKDMGSVMGAIKSKVGSRADGKILSQIVREKLSQ